MICRCDPHFAKLIGDKRNHGKLRNELTCLRTIPCDVHHFRFRRKQHSADLEFLCRRAEHEHQYGIIRYRNAFTGQYHPRDRRNDSYHSDARGRFPALARWKRNPRCGSIPDRRMERNCRIRYGLRHIRLWYFQILQRMIDVHIRSHSRKLLHRKPYWWERDTPHVHLHR